MTPHIDAERASAFSADHHATAAGSGPGIIDALLQALNGCGGYRLIDLGGELFLEPEGQRAPLAQGREVEF